MNTESTINDHPGVFIQRLSNALSAKALKFLLARCIARLKLMEDVRAERKQLAKLSNAMLDDIGIDLGAANQEAARSYFDLPQGRW